MYTSTSALTGKSAGAVAAQGVTRQDGTFVVGPLPADATYDVQVAKTGHVLEQEGQADGSSYKFTSKQLAQVSAEFGWTGCPLCSAAWRVAAAAHHCWWSYLHTAAACT